MSQNTGAAILVVGSILLHFVYGLDVWVTVGLCIFALALWTMPSPNYAKLKKKLLEAQTRLADAKTRKIESS